MIARKRPLPSVLSTATAGAVAFLLQTSASGAPPAAPSAPPPVDGKALPSDGFVRDWLVLEPGLYQPAWPPGVEALDGRPLSGESSLRVKAGDTATVFGSKLAWKAEKASTPDVDLAAATGVNPDTATLMGYVQAYLVSEAAVPAAQLSIGSKDLTAVYWNGRPVLRWDRHSPFGRDKLVAIVPVKKGANVLTVKSLNGHGGPWAVSARLLDDNGRPLPGIKVATTPDGKEPLAALDGDGYVRDVLVLGPAHYQHKPLAEGQLDFNHLTDEKHVQPVLNRKEWLNGHGVLWRDLHTDKPFVDFNEWARQHQSVVGQAQVESHAGVLINGVTWAAAYIQSEVERRNVVLELGANDHGKVLVDGKEVVRITDTGGLERPNKKARITLRKGRTLIALKSLNAAGNWQAKIGLFDDKGAPLTGVKVFLEPAAVSFVKP